MIETTVFLKNGCQFTFDGTMTFEDHPPNTTITNTGPRKLMSVNIRQVVAVVETELIDRSVFGKEEIGK